VGTLNWTLNNGATYATDCREGSASLLCDGVDDYARVGASGFLGNAFSTKTVALWFKPNTTTGTQTIFDEGGNTKGLAIRINKGALEAAVRDSSVSVSLTVSTPLSKTSWSHVAVSFDNGVFKLYYNGKEVGVVTGSFPSVAAHSDGAGLGASNGQDAFGGSATGNYYGGLIDDVQIYDQVLTRAEIWALGGVIYLAGSANPTDGAGDVPRTMTLSWTAGQYAGSHDVYLGTSFSDVNSAGRTNPMGLLVSQGQTDTTYDPGRLAFGTTYYWRVDEVNAPPDSTIFRGEVWSFTVEPYAYPLATQAIAVTASSVSSPEMSPQKTIDGSGMTGDLHGTAPTDMWLSATSAEPA